MGFFCHSQSSRYNSKPHQRGRYSAGNARLEYICSLDTRISSAFVFSFSHPYFVYLHQRPLSLSELTFQQFCRPPPPRLCDACLLVAIFAPRLHHVCEFATATSASQYTPAGVGVYVFMLLLCSYLTSGRALIHVIDAYFMYKGGGGKRRLKLFSFYVACYIFSL